MCLRGKLVEENYDDLERMCTERIEISVNGPIIAVNVPAGQWHRIVALESGTVVLSCKDGPWKPIEDVDTLKI